MGKSLNTTSFEKIMYHVEKKNLPISFLNITRLYTKKDIFKFVKNHFDINCEKIDKIFLYLIKNENFEDKSSFLDIYQRCFFKFIIFNGGIVSSKDIKQRFCERKPGAVCIMPKKRDDIASELESFIIILKFANEHLYMLNPELYHEIFQ